MTTRGKSVVGPVELYRYTAICWRDDCPGSLDTYGREEVLEIVREHVEECGCTVRVEVKGIVEVKPS